MAKLVFGLNQSSAWVARPLCARSGHRIAPLGRPRLSPLPTAPNPTASMRFKGGSAISNPNWNSGLTD